VTASASTSAARSGAARHLRHQPLAWRRTALPAALWQRRHHHARHGTGPTGSIARSVAGAPPATAQRWRSSSIAPSANSSSSAALQITLCWGSWLATRCRWQHIASLGRFGFAQHSAPACGHSAYHSIIARAARAGSRILLRLVAASARQRWRGIAIDGSAAAMAAAAQLLTWRRHYPGSSFSSAVSRSRLVYGSAIAARWQRQRAVPRFVT